MKGPADAHTVTHMQDPKKRKWVDSLAADVVYVSGRKRPQGEMNGKSGNINNVCSQLYPPGTVVPGNELICIFDADQVRPCRTMQVLLATFFACRLMPLPAVHQMHHVAAPKVAYSCSKLPSGLQQGLLPEDCAAF